jgi:hypothetical protein
MAIVRKQQDQKVTARSSQRFSRGSAPTVRECFPARLERAFGLAREGK